MKKNYTAFRAEECREKARELVGKMTLSQKVLQTLFSAPEIEELGVKSYNYWNEGLHGVARAGVATVFPQAITSAGSFDEELVKKIGDAVSTEARAKYNNHQKHGDHDIYKGLTFWSPNINIFRDPRWGRGHETLGEDPYLTSVLGVSFIEGLQGDDEKYMKAAACAKHFAVHSGPEDIRHSFNAEVSETDLRETYLPAFKAAVEEANVEAVMGAYNRTNGDPCCGNTRLLTDILRKEWGFKGHVTSDCWAIVDFLNGHKVVKNEVEAVAMAMNAGCDLNCGNLFVYLEDAVKQGLVDESRLDEALVNLFATRYKLGIMDDEEDNPYNKIDFLTADSPEMRLFNRSAAEQSAVLLKNDGLLPLKKEEIKTIGIIGPNADNRRSLVGNYEGTASRYVTVLEGLQDYLGDDVRVLYSEGCHLYMDKSSDNGLKGDRFAEAMGVCENSDVVVVCIGLDSGLEGEEGDKGNQYASGDKRDLKLPGLQSDLVRLAAQSGKPVVIVLLSGSALAIGEEADMVNAVLYGGYPGAQGGAAIARLLFGDVSPEGKLPITFYRTTEELPAFTDYAMKGRTYRYMTQEALYPFGYGLSYTSFALSGASLSGTVLGEEGIKVRVVLTNTGKMAGGETVQVYVKVDEEGTPNAQLKGVKKLHLAPGESETVEISLPQEAFGLFDETGKKKLAKGGCLVYVGTGQPDVRSEALTGRKSTCLRVEIPEEKYL